MAERPEDRDPAPERAPRARERSSTTVAAVVGGLVVAVLVLFWAVGIGFDGAEEPGVAETDVTVEETETAAGGEPAEEMVGTGAEAEAEQPVPEIEVEPAGEAGVAEEPAAEEPQGAD